MLHKAPSAAVNTPILILDNKDQGKGDVALAALPSRADVTLQRHPHRSSVSPAPSPERVGESPSPCLRHDNDPRRVRRRNVVLPPPYRDSSAFPNMNLVPIASRSNHAPPELRSVGTVTLPQNLVTQ